MKDLDALLKKHGLRKTTFRKELLELFFESNSSITSEEIKRKISATNDRVTIYRGLESFEKMGLIHRVPDNNNLTRYALCKTECNTHEHIHNHAHFVCNDCNQTYCIDEIEIPKIKDSKGFKIKSSKLTLEGSCPICATN